MRIRRVLIVAGASGGHLLPALELAEELGPKGIEILFVCSKRPGDRSILRQTKYRFFILNVQPLQKGPYKFFIFLFWLVCGIFESIIILLRFRPEVCAGFGGYVSVPLVIFSRILGVRTIIHEQNFIPGKANRLLANLVEKIAISFEETRNFLHFGTEKVVFTGNPVRRAILDSTEEDAYRFTGLKKDRFTILVMGGSQGSHRLNVILPEAFLLMDRKVRENLQVIHLAGESEVWFVEEAYRNCKIPCRVFGFSDRIGLFYRISRLIVARAGATTIAEIVAMKIPSILIPYPYANGHQRLNAKFLEELGAAIVLEEKDILAERIAQTISKIFSDRALLLRLQNSMERLVRLDASKRICEEVLNWES